MVKLRFTFGRQKQVDSQPKYVNGNLSVNIFPHQLALTMRLIPLLALLLFCISSSAQRTRCHRFIPFFNTYNPEKLAKRITRNLGNDSTKVLAIHCWITHHIKYDFKKANKYNFSRIAVKTILSKRKAICTGYSDLFIELCRKSGITAIDVPGYVKDLYVDINDNFYQPEHIWNAVYINNEWKLIDVGWDAGYVRKYKRTLRGWVLYLATNGERDVLKYKPHFKFAPTNDYFSIPADQFLVEHIPADPIWQLTPEIPIDHIERDSSFYFSRKNYTNATSDDGNLDDERLRIFRMNPKERELYTGFVNNKYNPNNHYEIGNSYFILANDLYETLGKKPILTSRVKATIDSTLIPLNVAREHYDSAFIKLQQQTRELSKNDEFKNKLVKIENAALISSTDKVIRNLRKGQNLSRKAKSVIRQINTQSKSDLKEFRRNDSYYRTDPLREFSLTNALKAEKNLSNLDDSIEQLNQQIGRRFAYFNNQFMVCKQRFQEYGEVSAQNRSLTASIIQHRRLFYDDMDNEVNPLKRTVIAAKFKGDSLLYTDSNEFLVQDLYDQLGQLKADLNKLNDFYKEQVNQLVQLKKNGREISTLDSIYSSILDNYELELIDYNYLGGVQSLFASTKNNCKVNLKPALKERRLYIKEKNVENRMHSLRKTHIERHCNGYTRVYKNALREADKMKKSLEEMRKEKADTQKATRKSP